MNSKQFKENENMKLEQVSRLNIFKLKASDNHLNIHDCSDPANICMLLTDIFAYIIW